MGVTSIDDDVTLFEVWLQLVDEGVNSWTSLDEKDDLTWSLELLAEFFNGVSTNDWLACGMLEEAPRA